MAGEDLITAYLARVRAVVGFRSDADAIILELEDHLRCGVERRTRAGLDEHAAQRAALAVIGDAGTVARELCRSKSGGVALPSPLSRVGGRASLLAAVMALAAVVPAYVRAGEVLDGRDTGPGYYTMGALLVLAGISSLLGLIGALARSGAGTGAGAICALTVAGLGIVVVAIAPWSHPVTLVLVWGPCVFGLVILARVVPLPVAVWATAAGWPLCAGALYLFNDWAALGAVDQYGDHPWAAFTATTLLALLWALGQVAVGRVLASERPPAMGASTLVA